jgi:hypothetical protein
MKGRIKAVRIERPMPLKIRPMMAQSSAQPFDNPGWIFEMKWDGYRAIATITPGQLQFGQGGGPNGAHNQLFFTGGPNGYANGIFGVITFGP